LVNLVSNSLKFTQQGEVLVSVKRKTTFGNKIELEFSVKDTGIGISPDKLDKLFKAFSQVDSSATRKFGGTGLGLAICDRLVELMNGKIWVESIWGEGSNFHFTIMAESAPAVPRPYLYRTPAELNGKKALIVDDNQTNRQILSLQCQSWGMQPEMAMGSQQALDWLKPGNKYDIAIVDMHMPDMDGAELVRKIRQKYPVKDLPIIMLSSVGKTESVLRLGHEMLNAYLTKPIKQSQLYNTLVEVLTHAAPVLQQRTATHQKLNPALGERLPLRILVAEDNSVNQKLMLLILNKLGYNADVAGNGLEVLALMARKS
jgi:CheY-like chemotaxis protein